MLDKLKEIVDRIEEELGYPVSAAETEDNIIIVEVDAPASAYDDIEAIVEDIIPDSDYQIKLT